MNRQIGQLSENFVGRSVSTFAPAKINLTLDVLGKRPDGYHEIRSLVIGIALRDSIRALVTPETRITVNCDNPLLKQADNLAFRAATEFQRLSPIRFGMTIEIIKRIPLAAGLGGGSSDAAATLRLCDAICGTQKSTEELCVAGACLGSDVPLFFHLPTAKLAGRGEIVSPVSMKWKGWVVLVCPPLAVLTPDAYRAWDQSEIVQMSEVRDAEILGASRARELSALVSNRLEDAAFSVCPQLKDFSEVLKRKYAAPFHMTGSGASLFQLFDDVDEAESIARQISSDLQIGTHVVEAPVGMSPLLSKEH